MNREPTTPVYSQELHAPMPQDDVTKTRSYSKFVILTVIGLQICIVIAAMLFALLYKHDNVVKSKLDSLARDYYENYLYDAFANSVQTSGNTTIEEVMEKHSARGLSRITLRQMLLHDAKGNADLAEYLRSYCNENKTYMQVFPDPPFDKTSYHIKYTYSCNFQ